MPPVTAMIDVTGDVCPMTFVRTRLALDRLQAGEVLEVRLRGEEPRRSVPEASRALGHQVICDDTDAAGITRLLIRKAA